MRPTLEPSAEFRKAYWDYRAHVLEPTEAAVSNLLRKWKRPKTWVPHKQDLTGVTVHQPIARTTSRIKRLESVEDKIRRHPDSKPFVGGMVPESFRKMHDTLGARIVVHVLSDLGLVHDFLKTQDDVLTIQKGKAVLPSKVAKELGVDGDLDVETPPSGYASIHYRVKLREKAPGAEENPVFEIQVRTLVEDAWAEIEHLVGYKREVKAPEVAKSFVILSQQLGAIDSHFDLLNDSMRRAQDAAFRKKPKKSTELGPESLPGALLKLDADLTCNQSEVNGMLRALKSYGIATVGDLLERGDGKITEIRKLWKSTAGRPAETFDVINVLTYMRPGADLAEVVEDAVARGGQWIRRRDSHEVEQLLRAITDIGLGDVKEKIGKYETGDVKEVARGWEDVTGEEPNALDIFFALYLRAQWGKDRTPEEAGKELGRFAAKK